jgi:predicted MPP superfamily phosphohydrolase
MKKALIAVLILFILFVAKAYYDTNTIEVRHYKIANSSLGEALKGLKVAHLSDMHMRSIGVIENKVLQILKKEKPDLLFITGDMIHFKGPFEPVTSFLQQIETPYGVYGVLGNTEYTNRNGTCILCHNEDSKEFKKDRKLVFLRNSSIPLTFGKDRINISGVDDPSSNKSDLRATSRGMRFEKASILLSHSPGVFEEAVDLDVDMIFCGHTHGGQVFLTKYLRSALHLDPVLDTLEGFFQEGKTLMYVNKGVGTSFLPFRFGVKPEVAFFTFDKNETESASSKLFPISSTESETVFTGVTFSHLIETFDLINYYKSSLPDTSNDSDLLFDFENGDELNRLNWECHKWFERSKEYATSGKFSLRVLLPPGKYPGIHFGGIKKDWSKADVLKMDLFNPAKRPFKFHIRIDDNKSGLEYADRFDTNIDIRPGMNHVSIPTRSIKTNMHSRPMDLKKIENMIGFVGNNPNPREFYIDNIRLE